MTVSGSDATIAIRTPSGVVSCEPGEIVCRRLGLDYQLNSILLEYEVPSQKLLAHHAIAVDLQELTDRSGPDGREADLALAEALAERLRTSVHRLWLVSVPRKQLTKLVGRLRAQALEGLGERRLRVADATKSPVVRASRRSKDEDMKKVFDEIDVRAKGALSRSDVHSYLCDYLGFGRAEADAFFQRRGAEGDGLSFDRFKEGYPRLNPFTLEKISGEVVIRKPGSLAEQQVSLDKLEDCEVYVCEPTGQVFADFCKRCLVMLGPCQTSVFVRDCEDCVFWIACGQLRTNNCLRCTFHMYSKTAPVIETSEDLAFAPWSARYPKCADHFARFGFDPARNLWNGIFDFTGSPERSNWRILPLAEVVELSIELDESPEALATLENPCPPVTHEALCAQPLDSGDCGQGVADIPQTRPEAPPPPAPSARPLAWAVDDRRCGGRPAGLRDFEERLRRRKGG